MIDLDSSSLQRLKLDEAYKIEYGSSDKLSNNSDQLLDVSTDELIVNAFWKPKFDNARMQVSVKNIVRISNVLEDFSKMPHFGS